VAAENVRNARVIAAQANTAVPLAQSRVVCLSATVVGLDANTDKVAVGGLDGVVSTAGAQNAALLGPGDSIPFGSCDLSDIHLNARIAGEGVAVIWEE
jgi:hypothetical protein